MQVTSYNTPAEAPTGEDGSTHGKSSKVDKPTKRRKVLQDDVGGHLALNYWFHPPDVCGSSATNGSFEAPYASKLWAQDFELWSQQLQSAQGR